MSAPSTSGATGQVRMAPGNVRPLVGRRRKRTSQVPSSGLAAQRLRQVRLIDNPTNRGLSASPLRRCKLPGLPVMVSQVPKSAHFYSSVRVPSNTTCSRSSPRSASTPGCSSTEHSPSNLNVARQGPRWLFTGREARSFWAMEAVGSRAGPLPNRPRRPSTPRSHEWVARSRAAGRCGLEGASPGTRQTGRPAASERDRRRLSGLRARRPTRAGSGGRGNDDGSEDRAVAVPRRAVTGNALTGAPLTAPDGTDR
jgi:hypothetical protein